MNNAGGNSAADGKIAADGGEAKKIFLWPGIAGGRGSRAVPEFASPAKCTECH